MSDCANKYCKEESNQSEPNKYKKLVIRLFGDEVSIGSLFTKEEILKDEINLNDSNNSDDSWASEQIPDTKKSLQVKIYSGIIELYHSKLIAKNLSVFQSKKISIIYFGRSSKFKYSLINIFRATILLI